MSLGVTAGETAAYFRYQIGRRMTYVCPPVSPSSDIMVWGTDSYTTSSAVCVAAIHARVLGSQQAGVVTFTIGPGAASFTGSVRNGITTGNETADDTSFTFDRSAEPGRVDGRTTTHFPIGFNDSVTVNCPPLGTFPQLLVGTDLYADDSSICAAAAQVGLITLTAGGAILVTPGGEQASFAGSVRNGVTSQDYNGGAASFRVAQVGAGVFVPKAAQGGTLAPTLTTANNPVTAAQVTKIAGPPPRTIDTAGFTGEGGGSSVPPRTLELTGFTGTGTIPIVAVPRNADPAVVAPRTILLPGFTGTGSIGFIAPKTINTSGLTAIGALQTP